MSFALALPYSLQTLPNDFGPITGPPAALVVDYRIQAPCRNNRIQLSQHVFSFLLDGTKELTTPGQAVLIDNRQFLLIRAGNCLMSEKLAPSQTYRSLLFFFPDALVERLLQRQDLRPVARHSTDGFAVLPYDAYVTHFVQSLLVLQQAPPAVQQRLLPAKFEEIMLYLLARQGPALLDQLRPGRAAAAPRQRLRQVVEANALSQLSVAELAFLCSMSESTFKRHFEQEFHTSPSRWGQQQRLQHAAYLLTARQQRPTDVYATAGFENLSSFTQAFKLHFGRTPKQFQQPI